MEVSCWVETIPDDGPKPSYDDLPIGPVAASKRVRGKPILAAKFSMVARDPIIGKAAPVNQLRLETEEERRLFKLGAGEGPFSVNLRYASELKRHSFTRTQGSKIGGKEIRPQCYSPKF